MKMNKKGFTLIEMLVVIAIIAILVAIIIPTVSGSTAKAKEAADVANIRSAVAEYQVKALTEGTATFAWPTKLNFKDQASADGSKVKYNATKLAENYEWDLGTGVTAPDAPTAG